MHSTHRISNTGSALHDKTPEPPETPHTQPHSSSRPRSNTLQQLVDLGKPMKATSSGNVKPDPAPLDTAKREQAGYMLGRALIHRPVQGDAFHDLEKANMAMNKARTTMTLGTANVYGPNNSKPVSAIHRAVAARRAIDQLDKDKTLNNYSIDAMEIEMAKIAQTGNCHEFSMLVLENHPPRKGEMLHQIDSRKGDHTWIESRNPKRAEGAIVMDAWARGPAAFAQDSHFARDPLRKTTLKLDYLDHRLLQQDVHKLQQQAHNVLSNAYHAKLDALSHLTDIPFIMYHPVSTLSVAFTKAATDHITHPADMQSSLFKLPAHLPAEPETLPSPLNKPHSTNTIKEIIRALFQPGKPTEPHPPLARPSLPEHDSKHGLRIELHATMVAREFGFSIKEAVAYAPDITDSLTQLHLETQRLNNTPAP